MVDLRGQLVHPLKLELTPSGLVLLAGLGLAGLAGLYVMRKGGLSKAASAAGAAAVDAVGDITSGAVGAVGAAVGLPTPEQTTTSAGVARWIIDHPAGGHFEASRWAGAPAYLTALTWANGSGSPPAAGTDLAARFPVPSYSNEHRRAPPAPEPARDELELFPVWMGS